MVLIFKNDNRIFTLFCLLNKTGYNFANNNRMHNLRMKIRHEMATKEANLDNFIKLFPKYHQSQILMAFLHFSEFPNFVLQQNKWETTLPKIQFLKAVPGIKKFYKDFNINSLFQYGKLTYAKHIESIDKEIAKELKNTQKFFHLKTNLKQIILIPNFLDAYCRGYGPTINKKQYIIYGPCTNLEGCKHLIRHEYLHGLVNPLSSKKIELIFKNILPLIKINERIKKQSYNSKKIIAFEYIVRALNIIYEDKIYKEDFQDLIRGEKQKGFDLIEEVIKKIKIALPYLK